MKGSAKIIKLTKEEQRLASENVRLAYYFASKWANKQTRLTKSQLDGICMVGLVKASKNYDKTRDATFATYATVCMKNEIFMRLRKESKPSRYGYVDRLFSDVKVRDEKGNEMPIEYMSDELQLESHETDIINVMWLQSAMDDMDKVDRQILRLYYDNNLTQHQIAKRLDLSQSYICRRLKGALEKLNNQYKQSQLAL